MYPWDRYAIRGGHSWGYSRAEMLSYPTDDMVVPRMKKELSNPAVRHLRGIASKLAESAGLPNNRIHQLTPER